MAESEVNVLVAQSYPTLCDPMDCSPPGSSVHGILQARILEWVAISYFSSLAVLMRITCTEQVHNKKAENSYLSVFSKCHHIMQLAGSINLGLLLVK